MSEPLIDTPDPAADPTQPLPQKKRRTWLWITLGAILIPVVIGSGLALLTTA